VGEWRRGRRRGRGRGGGAPVCCTHTRCAPVCARHARRKQRKRKQQDKIRQASPRQMRAACRLRLPPAASSSQLPASQQPLARARGGPRPPPPRHSSIELCTHRPSSLNEDVNPRPADPHLRTCQNSAYRAAALLRQRRATAANGRTWTRTIRTSAPRGVSRRNNRS
jgi:hypothetical protein